MIGPASPLPGAVPPGSCCPNDASRLHPPPWSGDQTRTGVELLFGSIWKAPEPARPNCAVHVFWPIAWIGSVLHSQPPYLPPIPWSACCHVPARLPALAADDALFVCDTDPP